MFRQVFRLCTLKGRRDLQLQHDMNYEESLIAKDGGVMAKPNRSFACQHLSYLQPAYLHLQKDIHTWLPSKDEKLMQI
jgi:hypothetical protein